MRCGLINLLPPCQPGQFKHAARLCLCPVDLWRYAEFAAVLQAYAGQDPVLDLGSPKLLALVLARRYGARIVVTDIVESLGDEVRVYARASNRGQLIGQVWDGTSMPARDGTFGFVYSVSVVEHMGGDGDSRAMTEIGRVLRPGGRAVVTVPVADKFSEIWMDGDPFGHQPVAADGRTFFSYIYDEQGVMRRLVEPSGLRLTHLEIRSETTPGWYENAYVKATVNPLSPRSIAMKMLDPLWARTKLRTHGGDWDGQGRGVALLTLEKPE